MKAVHPSNVRKSIKKDTFNGKRERESERDQRYRRRERQECKTWFIEREVINGRRVKRKNREKDKESKREKEQG